MTHRVNIVALTSEDVAVAEGLVLQTDHQRDGSVRVLRLGRITSAGRG